MRYPKKNFRYLGLSMCFSKRINWIISEVQRQNFFLKVFSSSDKVLAALGSGIGTCSVFLHSFPSQGNAQCSGKPLFFPVPVLTNFWPPKIFFVKTQRIRNKPSNFTNFFKTFYYIQAIEKCKKTLFRACLSKICSTFHVNLISMNMQQKKLANEVTWQNHQTDFHIMKIS